MVLYKKAVITSWVTAICLCLVTLISAISRHDLSYNVAINMVSYLGVYGIATYLSRGHSTEKIVLTFVNILGAAMLLSLTYVAFLKYVGMMQVVLMLLGIVGAVSALLAIWFNNKFEKPSKTESSSDK